MFIGDHYWLADDGRIWGSKSQMHVTEADAEYVAWKAAYDIDPSVWPADAGGVQTDAALQEVVGPLGMFVNLTYYSANARFLKINAGIRVLSIAPNTFASDFASRTQTNNAKQLMVADPLILALPWRMDDGTFVELTVADVDLLLLSMGSFSEECYSAEEQLAIDIGAGTVTTRAEVDAVYAAIPTDREGGSEILRARQPRRGRR